MRYDGQVKPSKRNKTPYAKTIEGAKQIRNTLYKPDEPCPKGHHSLRRVQSGRCLTCEKLGEYE